MVKLEWEAIHTQCCLKLYEVVHFILICFITSFTVWSRWLWVRAYTRHVHSQGHLALHVITTHARDVPVLFAFLDLQEVVSRYPCYVFAAG